MPKQSFKKVMRKENTPKSGPKSEQQLLQEAVDEIVNNQESPHRFTGFTSIDPLDFRSADELEAHISRSILPDPRTEYVSKLLDEIASKEKDNIHIETPTEQESDVKAQVLGGPGTAKKMGAPRADEIEGSDGPDLQERPWCDSLRGSPMGMGRLGTLAALNIRREGEYSKGETLQAQIASPPYDIPRRVGSHTEQYFTIGEVQYKWTGGFVEVFSSVERKVPLGTVRMIGGIPFFANQVYLKIDVSFLERILFRDYLISWTIPSDSISAEWIKEFKKVIFA